MSLGLDVSIAVFIFGLFWVLLFIPLPGIDKTTSITVQGEEYGVKFLYNSTLPEGDYWGSNDIISGETRLATRWLPTIQFISTCSHEFQHLKFELDQPELTTEEEHERMDGLQDSILPWNWQPECIGLLDERFSFLPVLQ